MAQCAKCGMELHPNPRTTYLRVNKATREAEFCHHACPKRNRKSTKKARKRVKPGRLSKLKWEVRKGEVYLRDEMHCRYLGFSACEGPLDVHHIIHRSKGGTDDLDNLILLCRRHHNMMHPTKQVRWSSSENL